MSTFPPGVALVVGGSGGIAASVCKQFGIDGSDVALTYFSNKTKGQELEQEIQGLGRKASSHALDTRDHAAIKRCIEEVISKYGRIHTLVFGAAGIAEQQLISEIDQKLWDEHMQGESGGFYQCCRAVIPHFRAQGGGSIVHMGSAGDIRWPARDGISVLPKSINEALVRGIASEEGQYNIRANSVLIGIIQAGMFDKFRARGALTPERQEQLKSILPLRRFGQPEEVAYAVTFLASERAAYVTGQQIAVAGGYGV